MTAPLFPAGAAEFPNDNPALHDGARWVCPDTIGSARALVRPRASGGAIPVVAAEAAPAPPRPPEKPLAERFRGPLDLDLGRILLVHRVEDIPPPPDFIYQPFVSSRREAAVEARPDADAAEAPFTAADVVSVGTLEAAVEAALAGQLRMPIDPRPCRVVDEREACRRVDRGWRVDVAPCVNVGASTEGIRARVRRRSIATVHVLPKSAPAPAPVELEAASA